MTSPTSCPVPGTSSRRRTIAAALTCAALLGTSLATAGTSAAKGRAPGEDDSSLRKAAAGAVAAGSAGYLVRVDDGSGVTAFATGLADRATRRPLRADDQFEIGSNTKTFMATIALQLVAEGKLALTDTVEQHLPGIVPNGQKITVRMLLQHTSGLFDYTEDEAFGKALVSGSKHPWTPKEIVAIATRHAPAFAPGAKDKWAYSNTNYILVGMVLEKVTGRSPATLVQQRIAGPLGLTRTYLPSRAATNTGSGYAHGYLLTFTGAMPRYTDVSTWPLGNWAGTAGAIISTPRELAGFLSALLGGRLLPPEQLALMKQIVPVGGGNGYGLGLLSLATPCGTVWGHNGGTLGHESLMVASADGRRTTVTDATTALVDEDVPGDPAEKLAAAKELAQLTAVCRMEGKPVPATGEED